ncbi:ATP-binding protein [Streptomyces avermitilis]
MDLGGNGDVHEDELRAPSSAGPLRGWLQPSLDVFIGRRRELASLGRLLRSARLLTLVGPGGVGKTRLALEFMRGWTTRQDAVVRLVELEALRDRDHLVPHTAAALGVRERPGLPALDALARALSGPTTVLVLDNCEHIIDACAELIAALLRRCPRLRILATSREALRVPGESVLRLGELTLPHYGAQATYASVLRSEAVQLFVERARSRAPEFRLTPDMAGAVAEICRRLDGLPLAIELAARRVGSLPVPQILAGLGDRLTLLTDGSRTGPRRHRELGAAVEWSYALLDPAEQTIFRHLSVLAGGFGTEGAQAVCAAADVPAHEVLRLLCALEMKSLVVSAHGPHDAARFRQLGPIRSYGLELLHSTGELPVARERALAWLTGLARPLSSMTPGDEMALRQLEREQENLAAAVEWTVHEGSDRHLLLATGLARLRHHQEQGTGSRRVLDTALRAVPESEVRRGALALAARLACSQADNAEGLRLAKESVARARGQAHTSQPWELADALDALAVAHLTRRDFPAAVRVYRVPVEGLAIVAAERGEVQRAARLALSAELLRARASVPAEPEWKSPQADGGLPACDP